VPPKRWAVVVSAWLNSSKFGLLLRRHANSGIANGQFNPLAAIAHFACPQHDLALLVNLQALLSRLSRICRSRIGSTISVPSFFCVCRSKR
jgi:hypothetical protein